jgi:heme/copper-type cytochrome/quinol oxidase subunit 3
MTFLWKALALFGLLFFAYCGIQIVQAWRYRNAVEKAIWFVVITGGGGFCLSVLLR